jgi:hypothetical protein
LKEEPGKARQKVESMPDLFHLVRSSGAAGLAIVGMTKNVGKTVTLNYLIDRFSHSGNTLGLLSAGYDGERVDRLTLREKPRILAPAGALVATAEACFEAAEADLEPLAASSFSTPLGEVFIGRVKRAGLVELAGPGSAAALQVLIERIKQYGAVQILVDGAINRLASASPSVTDATVLATGAAVAPLLDDIIHKTLFRCHILEAPAVDDPALLEAAREGLERGEAALLLCRNGSWEAEALHAPIPLLARAQLRRKFREGVEAVVLGGALIDQMLLEISRLSSPPPAVIIRDATKNFISPEAHARYLQSGGKIMVLQAIRLLAVTVNPTDPAGKDYDPGYFLQKLAAALAPRPVFDLVFEEGAVAR